MFRRRKIKTNVSTNLPFELLIAKLMKECCCPSSSMISLLSNLSTANIPISIKQKYHQNMFDKVIGGISVENVHSTKRDILLSEAKTIAKNDESIYAFSYNPQTTTFYKNGTIIDGQQTIYKKKDVIDEQTFISKIKSYVEINEMSKLDLLENQLKHDFLFTTIDKIPANFGQIRHELIAKDRGYKYKDFFMKPIKMFLLLTMFSDLITIFNKRRINWTVCGGTLIGAIRTGGIVPWDNNIDIMLIGGGGVKIVSDVYNGINQSEETDELKFVSNIKDFLELGYEISAINLETGNGWWTLNYSKTKLNQLLINNLPYEDMNGNIIRSEDNIREMESPHLDIFVIIPEKIGNIDGFIYRTEEWRNMYYFNTVYPKLIQLPNDKIENIAKIGNIDFSNLKIKTSTREIDFLVRVFFKEEDRFNYQFLLQDDIFPIKECQFNNLIINVPNKSIEILKGAYELDVLEVGKYGQNVLDLTKQHFIDMHKNFYNSFTKKVEKVEDSFVIGINQDKLVTLGNGFKIIDITDQLTANINNGPKNVKSLNRFNNSLVYDSIKKKFITLYRIVWKGNTNEDASGDSQNINSLWNKYPEYNGKYWTVISNCMGYAELDISNDFDMVISNNKIVNNSENMEDSRTFSVNDQIYVQTQGYINEYKIGITLSTLKDGELINRTVMKTGGGNEKNWMPFINNDQLYFYYNIHTQLIVKYDPNINIGEKNQTIWLCGGTNAIDYENGKKICLGHHKVPIEYVKNNIDKFPFMNFDNYYNHHTYVYWMFFMTFDPNNGKIDKISKMFIPTSITCTHMPYSLVFPLSIVDASTKYYYVSYGQGDIQCRIMRIAKEDVSGLLNEYRGDGNDFEYIFIS